MESEPAAPNTPRLIGLSAADVNQRTAAGAVNRVSTGPTRTVAEIVRANVFTVFNLLLSVLLVVVLFVAPPQDGLFGVVLISNALIGIIQELRAKRTLDRLALLSAPKAVTIRDDRRWEVPVDEVVLDDLLVAAPGDQIVRLVVMLPEGSDPELGDFVRRWADSHAYDPRSKAEDA